MGEAIIVVCKEKKKMQCLIQDGIKVCFLNSGTCVCEVRIVEAPSKQAPFKKITDHRCDIFDWL